MRASTSAALVLAALAAAPTLAADQVIRPATAGEVRRAPIADFPSCLDGAPGLIYATDAAGPTDCATGGGATEVLCQCSDGAYSAIGSGGGGGASALDDLTDVDTTGAATGEALIYTGAGWAPSDTAAILEGDARLTDARAPTAHADSHEAGGSDPIVLALSDLSDVDADGSAMVGDLLIFDGAEWVDGLPQLEDLGGTLSPAKGGTGLDTSAATGVPSIAAGTWSVGDVALGAQTSGGYAASVSEGGPATTATALAANGANCGAGQWAAGVDASGAAEGCTADATLAGSEAGGDLAGTYPNPTVAAGAVGVTELADDAGCGALQGVRRNAGDTAFECGSATSASCLNQDGDSNCEVSSDGTYVYLNPGDGAGNAMRFRVSGDAMLIDGFLAGAWRAVAYANQTGGIGYWSSGAASGALRSTAASATAPSVVPDVGDPDTGVGRSGSDNLRLISGGSSGLGISSAAVTNYRAVLGLTPQASAPACPLSEGGIYFDSSGAWCVCSPGGSWQMLFPAVPTTENCT